MIEPDRRLLEELLGELGTDVLPASGVTRHLSPAPSTPSATPPDRPARPGRPRLVAAVADLSSPHAARRRAALARLRGEADLDVSVVRPLLLDPDPGVRLLAVGAVTDHPHADVAELDPVRWDPDPAVRVAVLSALLRRGDEPALAAVALLAEEAQRGGRVDLFLAGLADVFRSAGGDPARLRALLALAPAWLPLSTPATRVMLAGAIGVVALQRAAEAAATSPNSRPVARALLDAYHAAAPAMNGDDEPPRRRRQETVTAVARAALTAATADPDPRVRARATDVLRRLPADEADTGEADPDVDIAFDVDVEGDQAAARVLARQLVDPDATVRRLAVDALARLGGGQGLPAVVAALRDEDTGVRRTARRHLTDQWSPDVARLVEAAAPRQSVQAGGPRALLDQLDEGAEGALGVDEGDRRTP